MVFWGYHPKETQKVVDVEYLGGSCFEVQSVLTMASGCLD